MVETGVEQRLAAILAADVAGYTRLMADDEKATIATITEFRSVFRGHIESNGGRVVDMAGDSILAVFASAAGAVRAAVAAQAALGEHNAELAEPRRMHFRVGINLGDIHEHPDGTVYGDGVNVAARLESLARPGGVMISEFAYQQVRRSPDMAFADAGEHDVKNVAEPVRAYRLLGGDEPDAAVKAPRRKRMAAAAALLVVVAGLLGWQVFRAPAMEMASMERMAFPLPEQPSIAVLPFDNLSADDTHNYLADGLSDNIISALSQVRGVMVIARNSTFTYKGMPVKVGQVAEELGVRYVLEGSIQVANERIRVNVKLIDAVDGGDMLSERYDRTLDDIFAVQDDITLNLVSALQVQLTEGPHALAWRGGTDSLEAWSLFQRGREHLLKFTSEDIAAARTLFEEAVAIDADFALGWASLGNAYRATIQFGYSSDYETDIAAARRHCEKAVALDPDSPDAQANLALIEWAEHDFDGALARMERAVTLSPNHSLVLGLAGFMTSFIGEPQTAVDLMQRAARLTPTQDNWYPFPLAQGYIRLGRYAEAHAAISDFIARTLRTERAATLLIASLAGLDRMPEAEANRDEIAAEYSDYSIAWVRDITDGIIPYSPEAFAPIAALLRKAGVPEEPPAPARPGIAVLPFDNLSGDAAQDYFADGLTETLITNLSRLDGLMVIARNSAFVFKGQAVDVREVGERLGVEYVVEGSVHILGERVRVNAQLVDATSGGHLWAEAYDRDMSDIFAVHDDISGRIVSALDITLSEGDADRLSKVETNSVEAYDSYIRGLADIYRYTPDANRLARASLREAVDIDPGYVRAYGILSIGMFLAWEFQWNDDPDLLNQAGKVASNAVRIDPDMAPAHGASGWISLWQRQYEQALAALQMAIEIDGNDVMTVGLLAEAFNYAGQPDEVPALYPRLKRIDPLYPLNDFYLGHAQYLMGDYDAAIASLNDTLTFAPNFSPAHRLLAAAYVELGRMDEAHAAVAEIRRISPTASVALWRERLPYRDPGVLDRLIENWEKAGLTADER